jgi:predicted metalloprotease with PDZ domain
VLRAFLAVAALAACVSAPRPGGTPAAPRGAYAIAYRVAMPDPASHLYEVALDVDGALGDTLRLELPVWSPGRYARMDFARNVQGFAATRADGAALPWSKADGSSWRVATGGARGVRVRYRVFANTLSGTFSVLDTAHANWNGAGLFMYVDGHKPDPVRLTVAPPPGWAAISGASDSLGQTEFAFPNYDLLVDTPTEVAPRAALMVDSFRVDGRMYRTVVHHNGGPGVSPAALAPVRARFVREVRAIVERQNRVIAPPPLDRYTFLFNIGYAGGDGMEHLYSTQIVNARPWLPDTGVLIPGISTASHEYFHTWNVKRVRPAALGPFDYTRSQHQPSLWVAEGWTQYYGDMTVHRAGIKDKSWLYQVMGGRLRYVSTSPGRRERSPRAASFDAPFFDGADAPMATNEEGTFVTYYYSGESRALALDLMIRAATDGARSLDDALRLLKRRTWDEAPTSTYYLQGRGYTEADVERAVSDAYGRDLRPWFERHVGGTEDVPWDEILALAGLRLTDAGVLAEIPDATAAQRRVRDGWLAGAGAAPAAPVPAAAPTR